MNWTIELIRSGPIFVEPIYGGATLCIEGTRRVFPQISPDAQGITLSISFKRPRKNFKVLRLLDYGVILGHRSIFPLAYETKIRLTNLAFFGKPKLDPVSFEPIFYVSLISQDLP